jgi:hypothetical protein
VLLLLLSLPPLLLLLLLLARAAAFKAPTCSGRSCRWMRRKRAGMLAQFASFVFAVGWLQPLVAAFRKQSQRSVLVQGHCIRPQLSRPPHC